MLIPEIMGSVLVLACAVDVPRELGAKKEREKLQGKWAVVAMQRPRELSKSVSDTFATFDRDRFTFQRKGSLAIIEATFWLDPTVTPARINLIPTTETMKGSLFTGIYSMEGDDLYICYSYGHLEGEKRPTRFASTDGNSHYLWILKRQKP